MTDKITEDLELVGKLIRNEFDRIGSGIEKHDWKIELIRSAESLGLYELAYEMKKDLLI